MTHRRPSSLTVVHMLLLLVGVFSLLVSSVQAQGDERRVIVLPTTGVVDQIMSTYLREGIARGVEEGATAVIIELDTPGGSLE
ncbi:MAG: hypothetical protein R6W93_05220, partial [Candidatus Limnocylindrales bacterium]